MGVIGPKSKEIVAPSSSQPKPPLTLKKWQTFRAEFELRRGRVDDWTEREEYDLIFNQLNDFWKMQVAKEERNLQKRQFWVKMINMEEGMDENEFMDALEKFIGMKVREVQKIPHGYLVECGSIEARSRVMNFHGVELNHRVVKVTYGEKSMTGNQIFDFVAQSLQLAKNVNG